MTQGTTMGAHDEPPSQITASHFAFLWRRGGVFSTFAFFTPFFCDDRFNLYCFCHISSFLLLVVCPATARGKIVCFDLLKIVVNRLRSMRDTISGRVLASSFWSAPRNNKITSSFAAPMSPLPKLYYKRSPAVRIGPQIRDWDRGKKSELEIY
jgi:hypothetical protein